MMKLNVIKVGGAVVENPESLAVFLDGFKAVEGAKILVHGGGRTATTIAAGLGIESRMVAGRRVTDGETLKIVTMVYAGLVNKGIVSGLQARGVKALGLTGADFGCMLADRRKPVEVDGVMVDYGFVGDVRSVDAEAIASVMETGAVPVMAPLTFDGIGGLLNTNADTVASSVAVAMAGLFDVTLTFCFEKPGVLADPDDDSSVIPVISAGDFERLKEDGTVSGGMLPKLQNAFSAIGSGVSKVVITSAMNLSGGTIVRHQ